MTTFEFRPAAVIVDRVAWYDAISFWCPLAKGGDHAVQNIYGQPVVDERISH